MSEQKRHAIMILFVVLVSLTLLAAPARGADWFGVQVGFGGLGFGFGSSDWAVYSSWWGSPSWTVDYHVALAGYGEWVWVDGIGQCWRPWVRPDWRPFTYGRWVWTTYGWTWVSYEPWGYFPHHYGHWAMTHAGWVWAPGTTYLSANVVWVQVGTRVGWYASPPPGWSHSHGGYSSGYVRGRHDGFSHGYHEGLSDGYWAGWNDARYATFVDWNHLGAEDLGRYTASAASVRTSVSNAVPRTGVSAPTRTELSRRGVSVPEMTLERRTVRVAGRDVMVARPREAATSIERNARSTVERALSPAAAETLSRRTAERARSAASTPESAASDQRATDQGRSAAMRPSPSAGTKRRDPAPSDAGRVPSSRPVTRSISSRAADRSSGSPARSEPIATLPSSQARSEDRRETSTSSSAGRRSSVSRSRSAAAQSNTRSRAEDGTARSRARATGTSSSESESRSEQRSGESDSSRSHAQARSRATSQRR